MSTFTIPTLVFGTPADDELVGSGRDDIIIGFAGEDRLIGGDEAGALTTVLGALTQLGGGDPDLEDAQIIAADVQAGNAVVQVINEVLLPLDL